MELKIIFVNVFRIYVICTWMVSFCVHILSEMWVNRRSSLNEHPLRVYTRHTHKNTHHHTFSRCFYGFRWKWHKFVTSYIAIQSLVVGINFTHWVAVLTRYCFLFPLWQYTINGCCFVISWASSHSCIVYICATNTQRSNQLKHFFLSCVCVCVAKISFLLIPSRMFFFVFVCRCFVLFVSPLWFPVGHSTRADISGKWYQRWMPSERSARARHTNTTNYKIIVSIQVFTQWLLVMRGEGGLICLSHCSA